MSKILKKDFMRVKVAQKRNLTTKDIHDLYGYGETTIRNMKRCKTYKEYRAQFCGRHDLVKKEERKDILAGIIVACICLAILVLVIVLILGGANVR